MGTTQKGPFISIILLISYLLIIKFISFVRSSLYTYAPCGEKTWRLYGMLLDNVRRRYYNNRHVMKHTLIPSKMSLDALVCKKNILISVKRKDSSLKKVNNICILWEVWLQRIKDSFPHQSVIIYFPQRSFLFPFMKEKPRLSFGWFD